MWLWLNHTRIETSRGKIFPQEGNDLTTAAQNAIDGAYFRISMAVYKIVKKNLRIDIDVKNLDLAPENPPQQIQKVGPIVILNCRGVFSEKTLLLLYYVTRCISLHVWDVVHWLVLVNQKH